MIYTSYSPNNERFGFSLRGSFRCSHSFEKLFISLGAALILIDIIVILSIWSSLEDYFGYTVKITTYLADPFNYGTAVLAMALLVYFGLFLLLFYIIGVSVVRLGKRYEFHATEERFQISTRGRRARTYIFIYDEVMGVSAREWGFPLSLGGIEVIITLKNGKKHTFHLVHTADSRAGGIVGTPFNIIQERAGLLSPHDYLI